MVDGEGFDVSKRELANQWMMSLDVSIGPPSVVTPSLVVINVLGARIDGPSLKANAIGPSGDWAKIQENGNWRIDARLAFQTDDNESFFCSYSGVVKMTDSLNARFAAGEVISGDDIYFRVAPVFETASAKYAWLNDILCVARAKEFSAGGLSYDVFEIL